jgi:hypothetical protein
MNITGKYMKAWKVEVKNGYTKLQLGDSSKQKDGTYVNWTWFDVTLMGKAKDVEINEGDVVEIKSGLIAKRKYNEKWYDDIKVFEIEVMQSAEKKAETFVSVDDDTFENNDIPF